MANTAMEHLGNVLQFIADLHADDRCRALDVAQEFYNLNNPDNIVAPSGLSFHRLVDDMFPEVEFLSVTRENAQLRKTVEELNEKVLDLEVALDLLEHSGGFGI